MAEVPDLSARGTFRTWTEDLARFGDTDRLGHINNAAFATFCETGRVAFLWQQLGGPPPGHAFVIARLELDFRAEMQWGGAVRIGTTLLALGRTSFRLGQGLFRDERCCATAQSVLVLMDEQTRRGVPLPEAWRAKLGGGSA